MKNSNRIVLCLMVVSIVLQSCSKRQPAPVVDLSKSKTEQYSKTTYNKNKRKSLIVKKGDTLYSIGFANDIDYKKLAVINNIQAPYRIYPGQKIKLKGNVTILTKKLPENTESSDVKTSPVDTKIFKPAIKKPVTTVVKKPVVTNNSKYYGQKQERTVLLRDCGVVLLVPL